MSPRRVQVSGKNAARRTPRIFVRQSDTSHIDGHSRGFQQEGAVSLKLQVAGEDILELGKILSKG